MFNISRRRRPVKRCRRGRFGGTSANPPSGCVFAFKPIYLCRVSCAPSWIRSLGWLLHGLILVLCIAAMALVLLIMDQDTRAAHVGGISPGAVSLLLRHLGKEGADANIRTRDISRMIERNVTSEKRTSSLRKQNRALSAQLARVRKKRTFRTVERSR